MIWELATPVFVGVLLALVAVVFLMGNLRDLARGPTQLMHSLRAGLRAGCACGHADGACRCGGCAAKKAAPTCGGH